MPPPHGMEKNNLLARIGDVRQILGFQRLELKDGKGKGNEVIQVRNGTGLNYQISVSRAFDIELCEFQGVPISWLSASGPVAPYFYEKDGTEWSRNFSGGLLTTCGLTYMGKPNVDQGVSLGQHGRISSTPAEVLQAEGYWNGPDYVLMFRAQVRESSALNENVKLVRTIVSRMGENQINITDKVTNESCQPVEHMILYHFNFGYPLVSETCHIKIPTGKRSWINGEGLLHGWDSFGKPDPQAVPTVMLHEQLQADHGRVEIGVENEVIHNGKKKKMSVTIDYSKEDCPFLTQWKHQGSGRYVLGIEPGNTTTEGRRVHRERGTLPFLEPGETKEYSFNINFQLVEE